jgi:hypothetical protein
LTGSQLAQKIKCAKPDVPVVLLSGFSALPPFELIFVDAHVGRGATLDELLDTMRNLIHPSATLRLRVQSCSVEPRSDLAERAIHVA